MAKNLTQRTSLFRFTKMHGLGNDFIVIDDLGKPKGSHAPLTPELARQACDRRLGIGADQILWLKAPEGQGAEVRMEILNSDGSTAEMCGNGIRAAALYLHRHAEGLKGRTDYRIESLAGVKAVRVSPEGTVRVDMGVPRLGAGFPSLGETLELLGEKHSFFEVNMGNPHAVLFVNELGEAPVERLGPVIERHPRFPDRTNVEFVQVEGPHEIRVRVWERGAGVTLACGTGACASAVASLATGQAQGTVRVHLPGGKLEISWAGEGKPVFMEGPATEVFQGEFFG